MRVAHVVNFVDEVGSYGGPLRVALNQVTELAARGHDMMLVAGASAGARSTPPSVLGDVQARLMPSLSMGGAGFATCWAPGVHTWLTRHARTYDAVHVHLGRDLTTAPATALLQALGVPFVVQTHGMIDPSERRLAAVLDTLLIRRTLGRAHRVLVLTDHEREDVVRVMRGRRFCSEQLPNGVVVRPPPESRLATPPEVLFLSRLHIRKRPMAFVGAALRLRAEGSDARFAVVGPDEGELPAVQAALLSQGAGLNSVRYEGPVPMGDSVGRLAKASVFVLPSVDEPFPMVLLEAMSASVPVVCTQSCGLARWVRDAGAGVVVPDDDEHALVAAVRGLLENPEAAADRGRRGRDLVRREFSIDAVATRLEVTYAQAARRRRRQPGGNRS